MIDLSEFFGEFSPLKQHLPGFQPRAGQAWMAEAVAEAIARCDKLVVEAGTGTGKTFAYLLPALLSDRKTIISTGTKALQDQLYHRDLPLVGKVIGRPVATALLKGRANYLCLERLGHVADVAATLADDLDAIQRLQEAGAAAIVMGWPVPDTLLSSTDSPTVAPAATVSSARVVFSRTGHFSSLCGV